MHLVGPGPSVQTIRPGVADQPIIQRVACAVQIGGPGQLQSLQALGEDEVDGGEDGVDILALFDDPVAVVVHDVGVGPASALQPVGAGGAVQGVVSSSAGQGVLGRVAGQRIVSGVSGSAERGLTQQDEVLQPLRQGVVDQGANGVDPTLRQLHDPVARVVDDVSVGALAAGQGDILGPVAGVAGHPRCAEIGLSAHHGRIVGMHVVALGRPAGHRVAVQAARMLQHLAHLGEQRGRAGGVVRPGNLVGGAQLLRHGGSGQHGGHQRHAQHHATPGF